MCVRKHASSRVACRAHVVTITGTSCTGGGYWISGDYFRQTSCRESAGNTRESDISKGGRNTKYYKGTQREVLFVGIEEMSESTKCHASDVRNFLNGFFNTCHARGRDNIRELLHRAYVNSASVIAHSARINEFHQGSLHRLERGQGLNVDPSRRCKNFYPRPPRDEAKRRSMHVVWSMMIYS